MEERQYVAEGVQIDEQDTATEFVAEGVQVNETVAAAAGTTIPIFHHHYQTLRKA